jgi:hypothetical protein
MPHRFSSFGLVVESTLDVPGVPPAADDGPVDVVVRLVETENVQTAGAPDERIWYISPERDPAGVPWLTVWRGDRFRFAYAEGAEFRVSADGGRVDGGWCRPLTASDAASYLLGPVLAFVLRLRGVVPLHAGAVVVRGGAMVFAGSAGAGKSSTVAALGALGHEVLSDDVVPLRVTAGGVVAAPGFPRVSVWDDTAAALSGHLGGALRRWSDSYGKRCIDLPERGLRFRDTPVPIAGIYVLDGRGARESRLKPFTPREAMLALAANTYGAYLLDRGMREVEFRVLGDVVRSVPVLSLRFDDDLGRLLETCAAFADGPVSR